MDFDPSFVSDGEPPEFIEPSEAAFNDPSMLAKFLAAVDIPSCDARRDLTMQTSAAAAAVIVGFVCVQLVRPASRPPTLPRDIRNGIKQVLKWRAVVDVGSGQQECERNAMPICDQVAFGARSASIGWIGPGRAAPFLAAMDELSMQARLQSMRSASRS
jgi:hypothetical protein